MRRAVIVFIALIVSLASYAGQRVIPVAGHLPGVNNTTWTTDISLSNNAAESATIDLVFHPEDGLARTRTLTLGPHQSMLLEDAVNPANFPGVNPAG